MNVVLYMRYSSDAQTEQSIEGQDRVCTEFCERNKYTVIRKYIDRATSASKDIDKRLEFLRMVDDAQRGNFEAVVVYKLDRFARNRYDSAIYKNKLKKAGVRVISATENISDSPEGVVLEAVLEGMAEYYSMELSQKVKRGQRESIMKGHALGGPVPLGYNRVDCKLVIDEGTAPVVKEIFRRFASGERAIDIINDLNERGIKTSFGRQFNRSSFHGLLSNKKYIGTLQFGEYVNEGAVPALVDEQTFYACQRRIESGKRNNPVKRTNDEGADYVLTGKLFCGECGSAMAGKCASSQTGARHYYYECHGSYSKKTCKKKRMKKDWLENSVFQIVSEIITPQLIDRLSDMAVAQNKKDIEKKEQLSYLQKSLAASKRKMDNLLKVAESGVDPEYIRPRINKLTEEIRETERKLAVAQENIIVITKEQCVYFLSQFLTGSLEDKAFRDNLLRILISRITVYDQDDKLFRVEIECNTAGETLTLRGKSSHLTEQAESQRLYANYLGLSFTFVYFLKAG